MADQTALSPTAVRALLAAALVACAVALLLRRRVPSRPRDVSADVYWTTAASPALIAWAPLEAASIAALYLYGHTGSALALAVAGVAWLLLVALNPRSLDRLASP